MLEMDLPGTDLVLGRVCPNFLDSCPAAFDTAVTHPVQPSAQAQATMVAGAAAEDCAVATVAYYGERCQARAWSYTGAVNQAGQRLIGKLTRAQALHWGEDPAEIAGLAWHSIACGVARAVATQLTKACAADWLQLAPPPAPTLPTTAPVGSYGPVVPLPVVMVHYSVSNAKLPFTVEGHPA